MPIVAVDAGLRDGAICIDRLKETKFAAAQDSVMGL